MYSPCIHHAYTQARDDDERVAAPEARPACPRQPRQRQLWAVGTCTSCSAVQAHHGVGQVLGGRELVLFVFQEETHAGARARATRRRQAWASSEEQYCVACWDEHLGVGAEAAGVPPLHRVDTFGQSMTASAEAAARARTGAAAARTSRGRPAASVALAPPASAYPRAMPAEAEVQFLAAGAAPGAGWLVDRCTNLVRRPPLAEASVELFKQSYVTIWLHSEGLCRQRPTEPKTHTERKIGVAGSAGIIVDSTMDE